MAQFRLPAVRNAGAALAIALIVASVVAAVIPPGGLLYLVPARVLSGFVWQLVTYGLLEVTPMGVIFGALILWSIGGALEATWGRRKLLVFALSMVVIGGVCTTLLAIPFQGLRTAAYPGGMVLTGSLWVAYGLQIGRGQANFWGMPVTGNALAGIGAGFVALNAAFGGLSAVLPEAFAMLATFFYMRGAQPGRLLQRLRAWRFERQYEKRASHLRSIEGGKRNQGGGSDRYLH